MSYASYRRLPVKEVKPQRPRGIAVMAVLGVLGSLVSIVLVLVALLMRSRLGIGLGFQSAILAGELAFALLALWVNWGLWELIRWAWWANLLLCILALVGGAIVLRSMPALAAALAKVQPAEVAQRFTNGMSISLVASLAYHIIAIIYLLSVRAAFRIGVKDERPLWERVQRF
jgi:hypothetical protein